MQKERPPPTHQASKVQKCVCILSKVEGQYAPTNIGRGMNDKMGAETAPLQNHITVSQFRRSSKGGVEFRFSKVGRGVKGNFECKEGVTCL